KVRASRRPMSRRHRAACGLHRHNMAAGCSLPRGSHLRLISLPARQAEKNAIRVLDRRYVSVVILDHFDRGAHLLGEEIYVNALGKPEGGIGMAETVGAPPSAG